MVLTKKLDKEKKLSKPKFMKLSHNSTSSSTSINSNTSKKAKKKLGLVPINNDN